MKFPFFLLSLIILLGIGCIDTPTTKEQSAEHSHPHLHSHAKSVIDYHSYAKPEEAITKHLDLNLKVDFTARQLQGYARWTIENKGAQQIFFDTRDLNIERITLDASETETSYKIMEADSILGSALKVDIAPNTSLVTIYYSTQPDNAAALDWLEPELTADKQHPALFTQGQAILTRTWIPCQDSPGIRITYDATIEVPKTLMAVMSASNPQEKNETGRYQFAMKQAIPPYLIALAVGDLVFQPIGARTGVYAEPSVIDAAVYEFAEMENMLEITEDLYGPYAWDRYDVIVLPPSFPFGGMENPRLTFATPTIIAGDRSLVALIAHELAHSWSGNLVTNATWDDFWLNEGFTVYIERRIMEALEGKEYVDMLAVLGKQDLEADIADLGAKSADTHLKLQLKDRDPDEGMTDIAYEKGAFFLEYLESQVGRSAFDEFLKGYFKTHQFQTLTTEKFINYLDKNLIQQHQLQVNLDEWIFAPSLPATMPAVTSQRFEAVDAAITKFMEKGDWTKLATEEWTTHEWLHFIRGLEKTDIGMRSLNILDDNFGLKQSGNSEILAAWFQLAIKKGYGKTILPEIETFLVKVGRRKFLTPLYRAMKEHDMMAEAIAIYKKARPNYHAVSRGTMDRLLNWS